MLRAWIGERRIRSHGGLPIVLAFSCLCVLSLGSVSCQAPLFSPSVLRPLEEGPPPANFTVAVEAGEYRRLHPDFVAERGPVRLLLPGGIERDLTPQRNETVGRFLTRVLSDDQRAPIHRIGIHRLGERNHLIVVEVHRLWKLGDLDQEVELHRGDEIFVPFEAESLLDEFFAARSILAVQ